MSSVPCRALTWPAPPSTLNHPLLPPLIHSLLPPVCVCSKRKLLEKQKEGKKRMRRVGSVDVPQEVFHELMKAGNKG